MLAAPHTTLGKKSQESKKFRTFSSDISSEDFRKFGLFTKGFISRFFQRLFSCDFLTLIRAIWTTLGSKARIIKYDIFII